MQVGIPVIDELETYRPTLVLLGPGLPEIEVPFAVPEGLGGLAFETSEAAPRFFDEPFTGTESWIVLEHELAAPEAGEFYLVAYPPDGRTGKFWVSWGREEVFGLNDLLTYPATVATVREFHEVDDEPLPLLPRLLSAISRVVQFLARLRFLR